MKAVLAIFALFSLTTVAIAEEKTVTGWVLDSACAFTKGLTKPVSRDCALACARKGSQLVILQDDGSVYWPISRSGSSRGPESAPSSLRRQTGHGDGKGIHARWLQRPCD